jgi:hypothetical protein
MLDESILSEGSRSSELYKETRLESIKLKRILKFSYKRVRVVNSLCPLLKSTTSRDSALINEPHRSPSYFLYTNCGKARTPDFVDYIDYVVERLSISRLFDY